LERRSPLVLTRRRGGSDVEQQVEATLIAANPGPVWRIGGKIETGLKVDHCVFPSIPPGLSAAPSLILRLENRHSGQQRVRVSYLANSLHWDANYVIRVMPDWKTARVFARATVNNQSGADYGQAELQLVAGAVRRINEGMGGGEGGGVGGGMFSVAGRQLFAAPPPPPLEPFYGYHLYTFPQPVDVPNDAIKTLPLFSNSDVRIRRTYVVTGEVYYNQGVEPSSLLDTPVELHLRFDNTKTNSLGDPLPAGVVRVYKTYRTGRDELIGEDSIPDTAPAEAVALDLGNAFDVVEKGLQTDYERIARNAAEAAYEITIRNHQSQSIVVQVNEPFNGDWQILSSSLPYKKASSTSARFDVPVPADGTTVLQYRVRVQWRD
jgi:hypothetical protein